MRTVVAVGGWAAEVQLLSDGDRSVLVAAGPPRTVTVRVPRRDGKPLVLTLQRLPGISAGVAAVRVDPDSLELSDNGVAGYDEQGRVLGHTHNCEGLGGPPDCGPYEGPLDEAMRR